MGMTTDWITYGWSLTYEAKPMCKYLYTCVLANGQQRETALVYKKKDIRRYKLMRKGATLSQFLNKFTQLLV